MLGIVQGSEDTPGLKGDYLVPFSHFTNMGTNSNFWQNWGLLKLGCFKLLTRALSMLHSTQHFQNHLPYIWQLNWDQKMRKQWEIMGFRAPENNVKYWHWLLYLHDPKGWTLWFFVPMERKHIYHLKNFFAIMNNLRTLNTEYEKSLPWYPDYLRYLMFAWSSARYGGFFRGSSCEGDAVVMDVTMVLVTVTSQLLVRHLCCEYCINSSTLILLSFLLYSRCLFPDSTLLSF